MTKNLLIVGSVLTLAVLAIAGLIYYFDPNRNKGAIGEAVVAASAICLRDSSSVVSSKVSAETKAKLVELSGHGELERSEVIKSVDIAVGEAAILEERDAVRECMRIEVYKLLKANGVTVVDDNPIVENTIEPKKVISERFKKLDYVTTLSTWSNGSTLTQCAPELEPRDGYKLVGGKLTNETKHPERYRAGCPPPKHCDGLNEFCYTRGREAACYINQNWINWAMKEYNWSNDDLTYEAICQ